MESHVDAKKNIILCIWFLTLKIENKKLSFSNMGGDVTFLTVNL